MSAFRGDAKNSAGVIGVPGEPMQTAQQIHDQYMALLCRQGPMMSTATASAATASNANNGYIGGSMIDGDGTLALTKGGMSRNAPHAQMMSIATNPPLDSASSAQLHGVDVNDKRGAATLQHEQLSASIVGTPPLPASYGMQQGKTVAQKKDEALLQHIFHGGTPNANVRRQQGQQHLQQHHYQLQQQLQQPNAKRRKTAGVTKAQQQAELMWSQYGNGEINNNKISDAYRRAQQQRANGKAGAPPTGMLGVRNAGGDMPFAPSAAHAGTRTGNGDMHGYDVEVRAERSETSPYHHPAPLLPSTGPVCVMTLKKTLASDETSACSDDDGGCLWSVRSLCSIRCRLMDRERLRCLGAFFHLSPALAHRRRRAAIAPRTRSARKFS